MALKYQTINEERGARRAAELRQRFRHVSETSIGRPQFGIWSKPEQASRSNRMLRRAQRNEFLIWAVLAAITVFFGFLLF
ncbi:MAG: hypothetical protein JJ866_24290 [Roseibium sp.]|uniref:hypothetical protein n=1 Tax=Roseibium sp. TaxID=1936156 RepID=UPI001B010287|nr:hypothetical protein [Roseibium sp.]MBO6508351.1 hypothetical protein [Roseibium sp.]MBO6895078.1 hypothetical protein [Roseibium sp.]MBO6931954.1 hypothetical protein [Roseibium sp.]